MGIIGEVWNGAVGVAEWLGGRRGVCVAGSVLVVVSW